jgi:hypothetical protein
MRLAALALMIAAASPGPRFRALDVYLDSDAAVAAWQIEIAGDAKIVGVEGGAAPFAAPPVYDPAALQAGRIVLAAFDTRAQLPAGRHRVATLHVREESTTRYAITLVAAGDARGERVAAATTLEERQP